MPQFLLLVSRPSPREATITALNTWEIGCLVFKAGRGLANEIVLNWYLTDQDHYDGMIFKAFMQALHDCFLPKGQ
ncbi:hypothetical protein C8Q80DRAFT_1265405 [Daedaleopsis nitida]|nr:hypothetical protein C8Q80DRAFT_1265405 [Daedaleopsis nitida]